MAFGRHLAMKSLERLTIKQDCNANGCLSINFALATAKILAS
jgi:hypothetical protein